MLSVLEAIGKLERPVFTTGEIHALRGGSPSSIVQSLSLLERQGIVQHVRRGLWIIALGRRREKVNPYTLASFVVTGARVYISFTSALHLHGIIEQIPQSITVASTAHTQTITTSAGTFYIHRIAPSFFKGYDWYSGSGSFLIAEPEKALVDCLYVSSRRNRRFTYFPELHFPSSFSKKRAREWVKKIPDARIRTNAGKKLERLLST
jgi:predicted transcriptional regulator of viral defense system